MFLIIQNFRNVFLAVLFIGNLFGCTDQTAQNDPVKITSAKWPSTFGFGRAALLEEIDSLNHDVSPDGEGLPPGSGNVIDGARIYSQKCVRCHGRTGKEGPYNKLVAIYKETDSL